jgi:hypothetical protein
MSHNSCKTLTSKATRSLGTDRCQEKTSSSPPVGSILDESSVCVLANIENIFGGVEFDDNGRFCIRSHSAEYVSGPVHDYFSSVEGSSENIRCTRSAET